MEDIKQPQRIEPSIDYEPQNPSPSNSIVDEPDKDLVSMECPDGFKITLSSSRYNVQQLCGVALQMKDEVSNPTKSKKEGSYLG